MPPSRLPPDDPREWLNRARSNLAQAGVKKPEIYLEDLCFQAQQAAEKALKALLLHKGAPFPHVHDLADLVGLLQRDGIFIPQIIRESVKLTDYAVEARYPGMSEPVTDAEYLEALALAQRVIRWVEEEMDK
jgi:HEPN domain-containing protein